MAFSDAQKEATARYNKKAYDRIEIFVRKGKKQVIKEFAQKQGKSTNKFINEAIEKAMAEAEEKGDACYPGVASLRSKRLHCPLLRASNPAD